MFFHELVQMGFSKLRQNWFPVLLFGLCGLYTFALFSPLISAGIHRGIVISEVPVFTEEGVQFDTLYVKNQFNYKTAKVTDSKLIEVLDEKLKYHADWVRAAYNMGTTPTGIRLVYGYVPTKIYYQGRNQPGTPKVDL